MARSRSDVGQRTNSTSVIGESEIGRHIRAVLAELSANNRFSLARTLAAFHRNPIVALTDPSKAR